MGVSILKHIETFPAIFVYIVSKQQRFDKEMWISVLRNSSFSFQYFSDAKIPFLSIIVVITLRISYHP